MPLFRQFLFYCTVIDGTKYAHIERGCIGAVAVGFQPCLIQHHRVAVYLDQKNVLTITELHEAGERGGVCFRRADSVQPLQLADDALHE